MTATYSPANFGADGQRFWDEVTSKFALRPDDRRVLEDACREIDLIEKMESALPKKQFTARGSMGQPVAHPLLSEIRQHRTALAGMLKQLKLPDEAGGSKAEKDTTINARSAAIARWGRR